ncbi:uncharacterized protein PHACADRAFT_178299 [Phanerochaete carnosa HHB-10118-sp]|uniref:AB hydrolase-1 domain-containing protein n=1 Tax=Phanerochaete carnosa (strain HHB-10118-sp) TaxID=650164 RepID=K5VUR7_PHACS|nr:uncharacterized protein PHACADRAFT_178299 [Phanerochaete carnosa HHB-10118-sp]EKM50560.1 hypothetical protein PHACADRAFT_178299 [Phanerochaete carnosa HHB-10118-sp]
MLQALQTLPVDDNGTKLAYLDSGVPSHTSPFGNRYITIFALHGMAFTCHAFEKIAIVASSAGVRFVAISRRDYPGSTPLSATDLRVLNDGTDEEKAQHVRNRGVEIATFIDKFVEQNELPPPDEKGSGGGFAILGWSLGGTHAFATVTNIDALADAARARFAHYMRLLIMLEVPDLPIGITPAPKSWGPTQYKSIPLDLRLPFFSGWITSYFTHGDLSKRDIDEIEYIVPSPAGVPSIYNMSAEQRAAIVYNDCALTSEIPLMTCCAAQLHATYEKAAFSKKLREILPNMKVLSLVGDSAASFTLVAMFVMEKDDAAHGGGNIQFRLIEGGNHLMFWDKPEVTLRTILDTMV